MRAIRSLAMVAIALALEGCAGAGMTLMGAGAGAGAGAGIEHTMNGIVFKTFAAPAREVRFAALKTLDRMGMPVTVDQKSEEGWKLSATAADRTIDIELQKLTEKTTRMRVVANHGEIFFKDSSTATEILTQTAQTLVDDPGPPKTKTKTTSSKKAS